MTVRVKICGVTTVEDALRSCAVGADLLGLNFYEPSPRFVDPNRARSIVDAVRAEHPQVRLVGVFVNAAPQRRSEIDQKLGLDLLQFHGDERAEEVLPHSHRAIRALALGAAALPSDLAPWKNCWATLIDGAHETLYGGSGEAWDFAAVAAYDKTSRLLLAGGLAPHNVRAAVEAVPGIWGVDVCSGIESRPGRKDAKKLERFFEALAATPAAGGSPSRKECEEF